MVGLPRTGPPQAAALSSVVGRRRHLYRDAPPAQDNKGRGGVGEEDQMEGLRAPPMVTPNGNLE